MEVDPPSKPIARSVRPSKPKSRTGCLTCRTRKVKCDEGKPTCQRCTRSGRTCDGYAPSRALIFDAESSSMERRGLQYFRNRTALQLSSYFDAPFWNKLILQAAQTDRAIRHCLIAIAYLHEGLELSYDSNHPCHLGGDGVKERSFSIQQYNHAIKELRLPRDNRPMTLENVLLACILFICYENLEGQYQNALNHLQSGLTILKGLRRTTFNYSNTSNMDMEVINNLTTIFDRLEHQYCQFMEASGPTMALPMIQDLSADNPQQPDLPDRLLTLSQARHYLDALLSWEMVAVAAMFSSADPRERNTILELILSVFGQWKTRFNGLLNQSRHRLDLDFQKAAIIMSMHATVATILPVTMSADNECIHDEYTEDFAFMVSEAKRLNAMAYRDPERRDNKVTFGFDLGITPVLYLIASRCRDPYLRRSAIEQLRVHHSRDGPWDSSIAARIAERMMIIEEDGIHHVNSCKDIPESKRIRLLSTDAHPHSGGMKLCFVRAPYDLESGLIEEDSVIWDPSKPIFGDHSARILFWNSIYCNTFSGPPKKKDSDPV